MGLGMDGARTSFIESRGGDLWDSLIVGASFCKLVSLQADIIAAFKRAESGSISRAISVGICMTKRLIMAICIVGMAVARSKRKTSTEIEFMRPSRRTGESYYGDQSLCYAYRYGQTPSSTIEPRTPTDNQQLNYWWQIVEHGFDSKTPLIEEKDIYGS